MRKYVRSHQNHQHRRRAGRADIFITVCSYCREILCRTYAACLSIAPAASTQQSHEVGRYPALPSRLPVRQTPPPTSPAARFIRSFHEHASCCTSISIRRASACFCALTSASCCLTITPRRTSKGDPSGYGGSSGARTRHDLLPCHRAFKTTGFERWRPCKGVFTLTSPLERHSQTSENAAVASLQPLCLLRATSLRTLVCVSAHGSAFRLVGDVPCCRQMFILAALKRLFRP